MNKFRVRLANANIAETRHLKIELAMQSLHTAVSAMDGYNREAFWDMVEEYAGMRGLLVAYATDNDGLNRDV